MIVLHFICLESGWNCNLNKGRTVRTSITTCIIDGYNNFSAAHEWSKRTGLCTI